MVFRTRLKYLASLMWLGLAGMSAAGQGTIRVPQDVATIQAAIDTASAGDTVIVSPGVYQENISFKGKAITVTTGAKSFSDSAAKSTLIEGASDGPVVVFTNAESSSAVLNGFTIEKGHSNTDDVNGGGILIAGASPMITNNIVTDNKGCGILIHSGSSPSITGNDIKGNIYGAPCTVPSPASMCSAYSSDPLGPFPGTGLAIVDGGTVTVVGNTIEDNTLDPSPGEYKCFAGVAILRGTDITLRNNVIRNNQAWTSPGIGTALAAPPSRLEIIQNLVYGNTDYDPAVSGQVTISGSSQPPYLTLIETNNTIYGGTEYLLLNFTSSLMENNVIIGTGYLTGSLLCQGNYVLPVIKHNDIYNTATGASGVDCSATPEDGLAVDPQFIDPASGNFHVPAASPIVAAGDINAPGIPSADLDGYARTVDGTIDMGVYEVHPSPVITLTATPNPAAGQSMVTLTATVAGNQVTPTGTITFLSGGSILGQAALSGGGVAVFQTSDLTVGSHILTAAYPGDFNFASSTSNPVTEVITGKPTTTTLNTVTPNPAQALKAITMAATVSSATTTPTGTVSFMADTAVLATVPVGRNGSAQATTSTLHAGTYSITAVYGGDTQFASSGSNAISETVLGFSTVTSLSASTSTAALGQTITLTAQVSGTQSGDALTGTVLFKDGTTTIGTANISASGTGSLSISSLSTGTHMLTATYEGSSDYNPSVSTPVRLVITGIPTSIGLSASPNPASVGQNIVLTATTISSVAGQVPTGTVTFADQSGILGTAPLSDGVASFSTTALSVGTHQIVATLNPSGAFASSTSATVAVAVNNSDFALTLSTSSLTIPSGGYQVLTATVTPHGGFSDAVTFECASVPDHAQCVFSPSTSRPLVDGAQSVQLVINTSDVFEYGAKVSSRNPQNAPFKRSPATLIATVGLICLPFAASRRRRNRGWQRLFLGIGLAGVLHGLIGCTGQIPGKTSPGTYTFTVKAQDANASNTLAHSAVVHLVVTQ